MVLGKFPVPGRPTIRIIVGQGPTALAIGAGGGCFGHFFSRLSFLFSYSLSLGWLVGWFGFNGPLRQYFSLYRAVSKGEGERRERIDESKNVQTTPPAPTASAVGPCPTVIKIVGRPGTGNLPSTIAPPDHPLSLGDGPI